MKKVRKVISITRIIHTKKIIEITSTGTTQEQL